MKGGDISINILIDTFGYDMTLNVYYKILKETEKLH